MFFLRRRIYIPFFVIWDSCLYHVLSHYFYWRECRYTTSDIQGSIFNILSWPICLHASSSNKISVYAYVLSNENALVWLERTDYDTFQCKRHVSPYEAMGTRVRVRLRVRLGVRVRARVIEQVKSETTRVRLGLGLGLGLGLARHELEHKAPPHHRARVSLTLTLTLPLTWHT